MATTSHIFWNHSSSSGHLSFPNEKLSVGWQLLEDEQLTLCSFEHDHFCYGAAGALPKSRLETEENPS